MKPDNISLRDWFAGMAMTSFIANETLRQALISDSPRPISNESVNAYISKEAYYIADKMMEKRHKK